MACTFKINPSLEEAPHVVTIWKETTTPVFRALIENCEDWIADPANGAMGIYYSWTYYAAMIDRHSRQFVFSDETTAFYFKMRFC